MTSVVHPRLVSHSPIAIALVVLLTMLIAVMEVPHGTPATMVSPPVSA